MMKSEVLAPAGNWDCLRAAVENGADAVYFGLDRHNARARADNFTTAEIKAIFDYLHLRGVKGYVTLNTLVFSTELPELETWLGQLADAHADAVIVQDLGLVRLIRAVAPDLAIHASTQMTITSRDGLAFARELGIKRVVLPRELSIAEIRKATADSLLPVEVFVHGALCVAYSGQCLTSESIGGRSANRGECAQACRLPYEVICDGKHVELDNLKYLLSPQDLAAYELLPELMAAGVASLKIEGRLKSPEYVANITRHYRAVVDAVAAGKPHQLPASTVNEMQLSFSRGFSTGWLNGVDHKYLVEGTNPSKRGVPIGEVTGHSRGRLRLALSGAIKAGDGIAFDLDRPEERNLGGRIFQIFRHGKPVSGEVDNGQVEVSLHGDVDSQRIPVGVRVFKTDDPELTARLRRSFANGADHRKLPIRFVIHAEPGKVLTLQAEILGGGQNLPEQRRSVTVQGDAPLSVAHDRPITQEIAEQQLSRLGKTTFTCHDVVLHAVGQPMVPMSMLNQLRRDAVAELEKLITTPASPAETKSHHQPSNLREFRESLEMQRRATSATESQPKLHVLFRHPSLLAELLTYTDLGDLYADFQDIREYANAIDRCRSAGRMLYIAPPRILKPGEEGMLESLAKMKPAGVLARNVQGLRFFRERGIEVVADYSLNAANELTVELLTSLGANRVTASYDLNEQQLFAMLAYGPSDWLEVVIHQHMPMFHMEHCVFCAVLSPGTNHTNCGRPCDHHQVKLRDRAGFEHPLHADVGCRNTLFNAVAQSASELVDRLNTLEVRHLRIELLEESVSEARRIVQLYTQLLAGKVEPRDVWMSLRAINKFGVTRGPLDVLH